MTWAVRAAVVLLMRLFFEQVQAFGPTGDRDGLGNSGGDGIVVEALAQSHGPWLAQAPGMSKLEAPHWRRGG
jgi:hypothetical protein